MRRCRAADRTRFRISGTTAQRFAAPAAPVSQLSTSAGRPANRAQRFEIDSLFRREVRAGFQKPLRVRATVPEVAEEGAA
jgi:hypothetical protein